MAIGYSPEPKEIIFHAIDYSNLSCIQGLLRYYYNYKELAMKKGNAELYCVYADIDTALENIKLTEKQKRVLKLYMAGWYETDIGKEMGNVTHQAISKHILSICKKISNFLN